MRQAPSEQKPNNKKPASPAGSQPHSAAARRRRRTKRSLQRAGILLAGVAILMGLAGVITLIIEGLPSFGNAASSATSSPTEQGTTPSLGFVGPTIQPADNMQLTPLNQSMLTLPENGRIDIHYFNDTVFVGDSLTVGLQQFSHIPNANYCAYIGIGPKEIYDGSLHTGLDDTQEQPLQALVGYAPSNVYILLGTNAMVSLSDEALLTYYDEMLNAMQAALPDTVDYYVQSITPVLQGVDDRFDAERIISLNNQLAQMAYEKGMYFVDIHSALADENGWLHVQYASTADAYHLSGEGYAAWVEYLITHTAFDTRHSHMYLEGSPYAQG